MIFPIESVDMRVDIYHTHIVTCDGTIKQLLSSSNQIAQY